MMLRRTRAQVAVLVLSLSSPLACCAAAGGERRLVASVRLVLWSGGGRGRGGAAVAGRLHVRRSTPITHKQVAMKE